MNSKRNAAIALLVKAGIWPVNYTPMGLRLLWRMGVDVPPLIFAGFWTNFLWSGGISSLIFFLLTEFLPYSFQDRTIGGLAIRIGVFWLIVGSIQAYSNRHLRLKHNLPLWQEIEG
ncbi:MAG TPA: DUF6404 family protein [Nitrosomonas sp.]|nr:DUF6404 family protein [Nitrosomonas sp.]